MAGYAIREELWGRVHDCREGGACRCVGDDFEGSKQPLSANAALIPLTRRIPARRQPRAAAKPLAPVMPLNTTQWRISRGKNPAISPSHWRPPREAACAPDQLLGRERQVRKQAFVAEGCMEFLLEPGEGAALVDGYGRRHSVTDEGENCGA